MVSMSHWGRFLRVSPWGSFFQIRTYILPEIGSKIETKEPALATKSSEAGSTDLRSDATLKKEERAKDGAKAMSEYQANGRLVREQMARLRALRLAKEAAEQQVKPAPKAPKAVAAKRK
jgi:hypothetical protein